MSNFFIVFPVVWDEMSKIITSFLNLMKKYDFCLNTWIK